MPISAGPKGSPQASSQRSPVGMNKPRAAPARPVRLAMTCRQTESLWEVDEAVGVDTTTPAARESRMETVIGIKGDIIC